MPVHILARPGLPERSPVMLLSGGVDSWKMDLHAMIMMFARDLPVRVVAFDLPGTGESQVRLGRPATQVIDGLVRTARAMTDGLVVHVGFSDGRRNCTARLIPNTGHCCSPRRREAVATIIEWLGGLGLR